MYQATIKTNGKEIVHNGTYIIQASSPEIYFKFDFFSFKIHLVPAKGDTKKMRIIGQLDNEIYNIIVQHPPTANEFGYLKDDNAFFSRDGIKYYMSFLFNKLKDDAYIMRINIYKDLEGSCDE